MSSWEIKDSVGRLVELTSREEEAIMSICRECLKEIAAGLKADVSTEDPRVTAAAAALAYYRILLRRNTEPVTEDFTSFKAGDISISRDKNSLSDKLKTAEDYYNKCMARIVPLCEDNGFAFKNVRIKVIP